MKKTSDENQPVTIGTVKLVIATALICVSCLGALYLAKQDIASIKHEQATAKLAADETKTELKETNAIAKVTTDNQNEVNSRMLRTGDVLVNGLANLEKTFENRMDRLEQKVDRLEQPHPTKTARVSTDADAN